MRWHVVASLVAVAVGSACPGRVPFDGGPIVDDGGAPSAGDDAGAADAGVDDGGAPVDEDAGVGDGGMPIDAGAPVDGGELDGGAFDAGDAGADAGFDAGLPALAYVFASERTGEYDVFAIAADGGAALRLTTAPERDTAPTVSPVNGRVLFSSGRSGRLELWILDMGTGLASLRPTGLTTSIHAAFTPDGQSVVFEGTTSALAPPDIYRLGDIEAADAGPPVQLTTDAARDAAPTVAADGTIYFVSNRSGAFEVWAMDADGSNQHQVTTGSGIVGKPAVSPDGTLLAWSRAGAGGASKIVLRDVGSGNQIDWSTQSDSEPSFSADGRRIVFSSLRTGNADVYVRPVDGGTAVQVTDDPANDGAAVFSTYAP